MYCCLCGKRVELAKMITPIDKANREKRFQMACLQCDIHVNKIVKESYSDKKAVAELEKDFILVINDLFTMEIERGIYNG